MKAASPMLLPLLRSPFQGELLAWLFLHPEGEFSLVELARRFEVSPATVTREADRFVAAGLIQERRHGNLRLLRARTDSVVAGPLAELLAVTYGPTAVLGTLLAQVPQVEEAYVYGSWAARYRGRPGDVPRDVDVLVIGDADEDDLYEVSRNAEHALGREVNIRRVSRQLWENPGDDPFLSAVRARPLVPLNLI
ncbi:MAG TPA: MarR family transcriptional regulator [Actinomadura sp.]|jgi:DNA-binding transcriptional ArsR family regulator|nr:MarR family transcriptional regulator [Actinomadura sp.]